MVTRSRLKRSGAGAKKRNRLKKVKPTFDAKGIKKEVKTLSSYNIGKIESIETNPNTANDSYLITNEDGEEFTVFENIETAESEARIQVRNTLEEEPELFNKDFLRQHIYVSDTDRRIIADEEADAYIEGLDDDEIKEVAGIDDIEEAKEKLHEEVYDEWYEGLENPIEFLVEDKGIYSEEDLMKQSFIQIDIEEATREAVNIDGFAHFINNYDDDYEETKGGFIVMQTDG